MRGRVWTRSAGVLAAALLYGAGWASCAGSNSKRCADGTICPPGKDCREGRCISSACGDGSVDVELGEQCDCGDTAVADVERPPLCNGPNDDRVGHCRTDCVLHCGDGVVNEVEECDGAPPPGLSCLELGFDAGRLVCSDTCTVVGGTVGCLHLGWQRQQRLTAENLRAIWAASASDIYVAGWAGAMLHYDGNSWQSMVLHDQGVPFTDRFFSLWGGGAGGRVYAGSEDTVLWQHEPVSGWTPIPLPTGAGRLGKDVNGIWGHASSDRVVAVGDVGQIWAFDGSSWRSVHQSDIPGPDPLLDMHGVWGTAGGDVYAVGDDFTILSATGDQWSVVATGLPDDPSDSNDDFNAVWGSGPGDIYVVGDNALVRRFNGVEWSSLDLSRLVADIPLRGVWGTGANNVFIVGNDGTTLHYNGVHWIALRPTLPEHLYGLWGTGSDNLYVIGNSGLIAHHSGVAWANIGFLTSSDLNDVWGASATHIFAVGDDGGAFHYDGWAWSQCPLYREGGEPLAVNEDLEALWGTADGTRLIAVGERGTILDCDVDRGPDCAGGCAEPGCQLLRCRSAGCDQTTGDCQVGHTGIDYRGVWGTDPNSIYVVGTRGRVVRFTGTQWLDIVHSLTDRDLNSVWGTSEGEVWIVGDYDDEASDPAPAVVMHRNPGGALTLERRSFFDQDLLQIWGSTAQDVYIAGKDGRIWHHDGAAWAPVESGTAQDLHGISGNSLGERFAVGANGAIVYNDGRDWQPIRSDTFERISSVWASDSLVVVVGRFGLIEMLVFTTR